MCEQRLHHILWRLLVIPHEVQRKLALFGAEPYVGECLNAAVLLDYGYREPRQIFGIEKTQRKDLLRCRFLLTPVGRHRFELIEDAWYLRRLNNSKRTPVLFQPPYRLSEFGAFTALECEFLQVHSGL